MTQGMIQTDFAGDRDQFGGDIAITSTVPAVHPRSGQPLNPTRASVNGDVGLKTFMKGDIHWKADPAKNFNFFPWTDDGGELSRKMFIELTLKKGFQPCKVEDWIIRPELAMIWSAENGQIVSVTSTSPLRPSRDVLMYRTEERWRQSERELQQAAGSERITGETTRKIADAISDKRVQALPTTVEVTPHLYNPEDYAADKQGGD